MEIICQEEPYRSQVKQKLQQLKLERNRQSKNQVERKHSIILAFAFFWFLPNFFEMYLPLRLNEHVVDLSQRMCVLILAYEVYKGVCFSRIFLKAALFAVFVAAVYDVLDYIIISYMIDNPFLYTIALVGKLINTMLLIGILVFTTLSIHHRGVRVTRVKNKLETARWRR